MKILVALQTISGAQLQTAPHLPTPTAGTAKNTSGMFRQESAMSIKADDLPLQCVYRWERERADRVFLTQPFGGGQVRDWTWAQAVDEARRMAAYLKAQNWEPGSRVAILSKNCAWWIMADLAIWMAGHVSVPIYPSLRAQSIRQILEHSEREGLFRRRHGRVEAASAPAARRTSPSIVFPDCTPRRRGRLERPDRSQSPDCRRRRPRDADDWPPSSTPPAPPGRPKA